MIFQSPRVFCFYIFFGAVQNAVIEDSQQSNANLLHSNGTPAHTLELNSISPLQGGNDSFNIKSSIDLLLKNMNRKIPMKEMNNIQNNYNDLVKKSKYIYGENKLKREKKLKADDNNDESNNSRVINTDGDVINVDETLEYGSDLKRKRPSLTMEKKMHEVGQHTKTPHRLENPKHTKKAKTFYAPDSNTDFDESTYKDRRKYQEDRKVKNGFDIEADRSETDFEPAVIKKPSMKFKSMKTKYDGSDQESKLTVPIRNKVFFIESDIDSSTRHRFITTEKELIVNYPKKPWYIMRSESNKKPIPLVDITPVSKAEKTSDELYRDYDHFPNEVVSSTTRKFKIDEPFKKSLKSQVVNIDVTEINEDQAKLVKTIETQTEIKSELAKLGKHNDNYDVDDITDRSLDIPKTNKFNNYGKATKKIALEDETVTRFLKTENKDNILRHYKTPTRQQHTGRKHPMNKHKNMRLHKQPYHFDTFSKKAHRLQYLLDKVTPDISFEIVDTTDAEDVAYTATRAMHQLNNMLHLKTTNKYKNRIQADNRHKIESSLLKSKSFSDINIKIHKNMIIPTTPVTALGSLTSIAKSKNLHNFTKVLNVEKSILTNLSSIVTQSNTSKIQKAMEKTVVDNVLENYNMQQLTTLRTKVDIDAKMYEKVLGVKPLKSTTVLNYTPQVVKNYHTNVMKNEKDTSFTSIIPTYTTFNKKSLTTRKLTEDKHISSLAKIKSTTHKILSLKLPKKVISESITPFYKKHFIETTTEHGFNGTLPVNFKLLDITKSVNKSTYLPWYMKHSNAISIYHDNTTTAPHKGKTETEQSLVTTSVEQMARNNVTEAVETQPFKNETIRKAEGGSNDDYGDEEDVFENDPIYTPDLFTSIANEIKINVTIPDTVKVKTNNKSVTGVTMEEPVNRYETKSMTERILQALLKLNPISQSEVTPSSVGLTNYTNTIFSIYKNLIRITLDVLLDNSPMNINRTLYTIIDEDKTPVNNDTSADENDEDFTDLIFSESFLKGVFSQVNMYDADNVTSTTKYSYLNSNLGENSDDQTDSDRDDSNTFENEPIFTDQEMHEYNSKAKSFVDTILQFILNKSVNRTSYNKTSFLMRENGLKSFSPAYKNIVNTVLKIFNNKTKNGRFYGNKTTSIANMTLIRTNDKIYPTLATTQQQKYHENVTSSSGKVFQEVVPLTGNVTRIAVLSKFNSNYVPVIPESMQKTIAPDKHNLRIIDKQSTETVDNKQADFYESMTNTTETIQIVTVSNIDLINLLSTKTSVTKKLDTFDRSINKKPYEHTVTALNSVVTKYTRSPFFVKGTNITLIVDDVTKRTYQSKNLMHDNLREKNIYNKTESTSIATDARNLKLKPKEFVDIFTQPIGQIYEEYGKKYIDYEDYEDVTSTTKLKMFTTTINYKDYDNDNNKSKNHLSDMKVNRKVEHLLPFTEKNKDKTTPTQTTAFSKAITKSFAKENSANNITISAIPVDMPVTLFSPTQPNGSTTTKTVSNQTTSSTLLHKNTSSLLLTASVVTVTTNTTTASTNVHESTNLNVLSTAAAKKLLTQNRTKWISDEWIFEENDKKLSTKKSKIFPKTALQEITRNNNNLPHRTENLQVLEKAVIENRASLVDIINDLDKLNAALVLYNKELMTTVEPYARGVTPYETSPQTLTDIKPEDLEEMLYYEMPVKKKEIESSTPKIFFNETSILTQDTLNTVVKELQLMNDFAEIHKYTDSDVKVIKTGSYPSKVNPHDPNLGDVLRKMILKPKAPELTSKKPEKLSFLESESNELHPKVISVDDKNLEKILQNILLHYTLEKPEKTTEISKTVTPLQQNMTNQSPVKVYDWKNIGNSVLGNTRKNQEQTCPTVHCFVINSADKSNPRIKVFKLPEDQETLYPLTSRLNETKLNNKYNDIKTFPNAKLNGGENEEKLLPAYQMANAVDKNDMTKLNQTLLSALKPIKSFFYKKPSIETFVPDSNNLKQVQEQFMRPVAPSYVSPAITCGVDNAPFRNIKEGEDDIKTYPWLGVLIYPKGKKRLVTTVILVTAQLVIASAWEINKLPKEDFRYCAKVILGQNCTGPRIGVVNYNYHPDFRVGFYSALAVIQIDTSYVINKLQPICPPPQLILQPQYYSIVMPEDCTSSKVNVFKMDQVPLDLCKQYYRRTRLETSRFWPRHSMCGKARRGGICRWRAGTALVSRQDNRWHLLGFSVSGPGCEAPARFLDYSMHTRWVELTVDRIGQPAITRIAPNKLVFRRSLNQIQRFGPCDKEELFTTIFRDSTDVLKPPGTKRETSRIYYNLTILKDMDYQCLVFQADNMADQWLPLPKLEIRKNKIRAAPFDRNPAALGFNITIEYYDDIQYKVQAYGLKPDGTSSKTPKHDNLIITSKNYDTKIKSNHNDDVVRPDETEKNEYYEGGGQNMQHATYWNEKTVYADNYVDSEEKAKHVENDKPLKSFWEVKTKYSDDDTAKNNENDKHADKDNEMKPVWEVNGRRYIRRKSLEKYKNSYTHNFHSKTAMRSRRRTVENSNRRLAKERGRRRQKKTSSNVDSKSKKHNTRTRQR